MYINRSTSNLDPVSCVHAASRQFVRQRTTLALPRIGKIVAAVLLGLCGLGASCKNAAALSVCVSDDVGLHLALQLAPLQSDPYVIKLVQGVHTLTTDELYRDPFWYAPTSILGGYEPGCAEATRVVNAANTVIDFAGHALAVQAVSDVESLLEFDGLTMRNGKNLALSGSYPAGKVRITNARLTNFVGPPSFVGKGVIGMSSAGSVTLINVVFDHLLQTAGGSCAILINGADDMHGYLSYLTADLSSSQRVCLAGDPTSHYDIYNSIVWNSDGSGGGFLGVSQPGESTASYEAVLGNDIFHSYDADAAPVITNKTDADPKWVSPATGDYHLQAASSAVNSGYPVPPSGTPKYDVAHQTRFIGSFPDRGAYESPYNDSSVLTVTKIADTNDGSCDLADCSLREAITAANSLPNAAKILFKIPGACPQVIKLNSLLPLITSPIEIDGYSQAGASENTAVEGDSVAFNATLCVVVMPASATQARGFGVAAAAPATASLFLHGVGMGGFSQAVVLVGGSNHKVTGNQFGGVVAGVFLPGADTYAVSIGGSAGGSPLSIGGQYAADRNVILGAGVGVNVSSNFVGSAGNCQVTNNLIGANPDGNTKVGNDYGIELGSPGGCSVFRNRIVGNALDAIWINGGNNNIIQQNVIGEYINGSGALNSGAGVRVSTGTGNVVGKSELSGSSSALLANRIRFMAAGGIVDTDANANSNTFRGNIVYDNGSAGAGMDVDLAPLGPSPNDLNDADAGPNNLLNFPVGSNVTFPVQPTAGSKNFAATVAGSLNSKPGEYRIDVYFSNGCSSNGRGHAQAYVGTTVSRVVIPPGSNSVSFTVPVVLPNYLPDAQLSLTATDLGGSTSELGTCFFQSADIIFQNGFGP